MAPKSVICALGPHGTSSLSLIASLTKIGPGISEKSLQTQLESVEDEDMIASGQR